MLNRKETFELTADRAKTLFHAMKANLIQYTKALSEKMEKLEWFVREPPDRRFSTEDMMLLVYNSVEGNLNHIQHEFQELLALKLRINAMEKPRDENETAQGS